MNKYKLGELTEEYEEINIAGELSSIDNLQGINNNKYFQQSNSNKNDIDLDRYKICRNNTFAYNKATSRNGEKISIAYRTTGDCLVSPSYITFKVKRPDLILDEYLMLWFRRPEFDRYVRFNSWGSATEFFTYKDFAETLISIPSKEEQLLIINEYKKIMNRIENLEQIDKKTQECIYEIYKKVTAKKSKSTSLSSISNILMGTSPEGETLNTKGVGEIFYQGKTDFGFRYPNVRCYTTNSKKSAKKGDILMSVRAPVGAINIAKQDCSIGRGIASISTKENKSFIFYALLDLENEFKRFNDEGTVFGSITKDDLFNIKVVSMTKEELQEFNSVAEPADKYIEQNELELFELRRIRDLIYLKIS